MVLPWIRILPDSKGRKFDMSARRATESSATDPIKVIERKDGFYWRDEETGAELGPFPSAAAARGSPVLQKVSNAI